MRRTALTALILVPMLALGASACGGGDDRATASGTGKPAAGDDGKMREFAKCMRENGVPMEDPSSENGRTTVRLGGKPGSAQESKAKAATEKCRKLLPNGGKPKKLDAKELAERREMAKCMRENGVPGFPDPNTDGVMAMKKDKGLDPENPTFKKAQKACMPGGVPGPRKVEGK